VPGRDPIRTCTGCGKARPKAEMVRVAVAPGGEFLPDLSGKAPGRGAYLCPDPDCVGRAARGRLAAVLKAPAAPGGPAALAATLQEGISLALRIRVLSLLGLAQRQGAAVSGTSLAEGEIRQGRRSWGLLLVAEDASPGVVAKVARRAGEAGVGVESFLTREEIGGAIGKSPRSAVLIREGSLARALADAVARARSVPKGRTQEESGNG